MVEGVLSYFARHRTAANLLLVVLVTLGFVSFPNMRAQFFPDVIVDSVTVSVTWDGAGAEDVDNGIIQILEPTIIAVEGWSNPTRPPARAAPRSGSISNRAGTWPAPRPTCNPPWIQ